MKKVLLTLGALLYAMYLEIYKNQIFGWFLALAILVIFIVVRVKVVSKSKWSIKLLSTVAFIVLLGLNAFISAPKEQRVSAIDGKGNGLSEIVTVANGLVQGINNSDGTVEIFAGIPYAKAPIGELRWREPQPAEDWEGVKACDTYGPMAMQKRGNPIYSFGSQIVGYNEIPVSLDDNYLEAMSEDCLYLNIWKPKSAKEGDKLPVLFYIHGGSLNSGQSYFDAYNGETLASKGIIVVNISYRLGVFGYLADDELVAESPNQTTGNYGLLDQIAALKWVNDNIDSFGGDASNITISGESAGASSVNAVCVSPLAKGLFKRAIAESSGIVAKTPYHTFRTMEDAKEVASNIKAEFSCKTIDELRAVPAEKLVNTAFQNNEMTVDGYAIVEQPYLTYLAGNNNEEAVLGGYNGTEAEVFMMFDAMPDVDSYTEYLSKIAGSYANEMAALRPVSTKEEAADSFKDIVGMAWFGYSHYRWSELMSAQGKPAYMYYFTKQNGSLSDWHSGELPYFYGNLKHNKNYDESDFALSETIQGYILNFVKTGNPNGAGLPVWETYNDSPSKVLRLDSKVQMEENTYLDVFGVFDKYMEE